MANAAELNLQSARSQRLRWLLLLTLLLVAVGSAGSWQLGLFGNPGCSWPGATCTRVLFIGNSYTSVNDLPTTFANLAWSGGHRTHVESLTNGGETLAGHQADSATASTINSQSWTTVVLQDQSENPASPYYRQAEMDPAAAQLVKTIRNAGAQPLLFLTWAHQSGWPQAGLDDYATMQSAVDQGYLDLSTQLTVPIAPVGPAWQQVISSQSNPGLWQSDGTHPTTAGTYLAACVFYATIFRQNPTGLSFHDGLSDSDAAMLQRVAGSTVLDDPAKWSLPRN